MTSTTTTNFDPALKQLYRSSNVEDLTYKQRPLFGMLPKFEGFGGRNMPVVLKYGNPQGRSATFATAQANRTHVRLEDFLLTRKNDYSIATIEGEIVEASRGDNVAFLSALKTKIDSAMASLADAIESFLFRSGTGSLAQAGTINTTSLTLSDINDVPNFEVGMELVASAADGGSLRTGSASVTAVDRSNGILTTDSNWTSQITSFAAADYVYVEGDAAAGSTNKKVSGLASWLPSTAPTGGDNHFGVDRSVDSRLYGTIHSGTTDTVEEAAIDAQSKVAREGGKPDCFVINHVQMRRLIKELGAKKEYSEVNAQGKKGSVANVGYRSVCIQGDHGPIDVIAANKCQSTKGWMLQKDTWTLATLGNATKFLMEDGLRILRQAADDGYEVRLGFRGNLCTKAPIWNANVTLPSAT